MSMSDITIDTQPSHGTNLNANKTTDINVQYHNTHVVDTSTFKLCNQICHSYMHTCTCICTIVNYYVEIHNRRKFLPNYLPSLIGKVNVITMIILLSVNNNKVAGLVKIFVQQNSTYTYNQPFHSYTHTYPYVYMYVYLSVVVPP